MSVTIITTDNVGREVLNNNSNLTEVYLLSIFDKSAYENISDKALRYLIADIQNQIKENSSENQTTEEE